MGSVMKKMMMFLAAAAALSGCASVPEVKSSATPALAEARAPLEVRTGSRIPRAKSTADSVKTTGAEGANEVRNQMEQIEISKMAK